MAPAKRYVRGSIFDNLILENFVGSASAPLLKTKCLTEVGAFDVLMQSSQDYDAWLRIAQRYEVDFVEEPLLLYYTYDGDRISNNNTKKINGTKRLIEKNKDYLNKHKKAWCSKYIALCNCYSKSGQQKEAWRLWRQGVKKCPENINSNIKAILKILFRMARD